LESAFPASAIANVRPAPVNLSVPKLLDIPPTGVKMKGRRSTPGRYFQVAEPGTGWGGANISDPLSILGPFNPKA